MTILYIDTEHDLIVDDPVSGPAHRALIDRARQRIETASELPCLVTRFADVMPETTERTRATAIVIGGCTTDWAEYDFAELTGVLETIRAAPVPILGICAGHQLIGHAHGAAWGPLGSLAADETDSDPHMAPRQRKEQGFLPVHLDLRCPLFRHLPPIGTFVQSHYWQLEDVPDGFVARASSPSSPIQAIERRDRPVYGVQFHPERHDDANRDGERVLRTFFTLPRTG